MLETIKLEQLGCPSCVKKIEVGVKQQDGVNSVDVLFNSSKVKVDFDEETITRKDIEVVIEKLGYTVKG
ncbi:metal transporter [Halolactibacillus miurensis]|uniref:Heavy-metal-associated domain-containing protein n=1 Tax=Halolactibacillus miurensis TaxID=306541 RepID=A0A1I6PAQ7_9BACI|nr:MULTISPECIES: cation transporter [Halolactibacillus]GEM05914.1 metal transporter [Halolactibacillus miurensis]SFS37266.1 Heavy-metal-associated domain-containing protein [Halolactibacillus miurensis]